MMIQGRMPLFVYSPWCFLAFWWHISLINIKFSMVNDIPYMVYYANVKSADHDI